MRYVWLGYVIKEFDTFGDSSFERHQIIIVKSSFSRVGHENIVETTLRKTRVSTGVGL